MDELRSGPLLEIRLLLILKSYCNEWVEGMFGGMGRGWFWSIFMIGRITDYDELLIGGITGIISLLGGMTGITFRFGETTRTIFYLWGYR